MQGGFSFCGTDIADLDLEYVPETTNTYVFAGSDYKVHEQTFDGHDGGYFYGSTVAPKVFTLRCIFQERHINDGILTKVERFFRRGRSGRLIFKNRPWVYYVATVTDINVNTITNYLNGIVTIQMKAYYPFGRCDYMFYPEGYEYEANMTANSAMLPQTMAVATSAVADGEELTTQTEIYLYNGGTERAAVAIEIAGDVGDGVTIANATTGQKCSFVALSKAVTSDKGRYIISDGINGRTLLTNGTETVDASLYHDYGFIELEPSEILVNGEEYIKSSGDVVRQSSSPLWPENIIGNQMFVDGQWRQILAWNGSYHNGVRLLPAVEGNGTVNPVVATMNKIVITPASTMAQTKLNFIYKPTFA